MHNSLWNKSAKALLSVGLVASLWVPVSQTTAQAVAPASDLFISEYIEGSSLNKAIEIYNGTGSSIDLSPYSVALYANGSTSVQSEMALSGNVASGDTVVLYNSGADPAVQEQGDLQNNGVINFNGDDALVLEKDGLPIDSIGQVGTRIENTKDVTLVRNPDVQSGDSVVDDAFDPSTEWTAYPADTFEHLGSHTMEGAGEIPVPDPELQPVEPKKNLRYENLNKKKLTVGQPSVSLTLDGKASITDGVYMKGKYGEFHGTGFEDVKVVLSPARTESIFDFTGIEVKHVVVDGEKVSEIRGAENIQEIEFIDGADYEAIRFYNSDGEPISSPHLPKENKAPVATKVFAGEQVWAGDRLQYDLTEYFSDPEGQSLSFSSTKGTITGANLTLDLPEGSHIVGVTASDGNQSVTQSFSVTVSAEAPAPDEYYDTAEGLQGEALKAELHEIIDGHTELSYSQVWDALKITDEDPNNPNNVLLLYTGESRSKSLNGGNVGDWNREHTWAKSHGGFGTARGAGTDIHHLRPTDVQVNGLRGNLDFDYGGSAVSGCDGCLRTATSWEPPDEVKGDVARMLFYMAVRYESGDAVDLELNDLVNNGSTPYHGKISVLLEWHEQDPVSAWEQQRNEKIEDIQGNRNPFVDYPEWAESIW